VTIDRSRVVHDAPLIGPPHADSSAVDAASDAFFDFIDATRVDRIVLSPHAQGLIAAGLAVRAFLLDRVDEIRQRIALGNGRWLVFESGIYGVRY
jgi:hypothetical protein